MKKGKLTTTLLFSILVLMLCNSFIAIDRREEDSNPRNLDKGTRIEGAGSYDETFIHIDGSQPNNWTWTAGNYSWCYQEGNYYIIENVTVDAGGMGSGILIENSKEYFIIRNCTITNSASDSEEGGIKLDGVTNGTILNNNITENNLGIRTMNNCENITISSNNVTNNHYGMYIRDAEVIISNNNFTDNTGYGLYMYTGCDNSEILNNTFTRDRTGISFRSPYATINNNTFYSCTDAAIQINANYATISGNTMFYCGINFYSGATGLEIYTNNTVNGKAVYFYKWQEGLVKADFLTAGEPGQIIVYGCDEGVIEDFTIGNSSYPIDVQYCDNFTVRNNTIKNPNQHGIRLRISTECLIINNTVEDLDWYGIYLENSDQNNITLNKVHGNNNQLNVRGIYISSASDYNNVSFNELSANAQGIRLFNCQYNTIKNNTIKDNYYEGIYMFRDADRNYIVNNTIIETGSGYTQQTGIELVDSEGHFPDHNHIIDNIIKGHQAEGIYLENVDYNTISRNIIMDNDDEGILLYLSSNHNTVFKNHICDTAAGYEQNVGIRLLTSALGSPDYNNITGNTCVGHSSNGITTFDVDHCTFEGNNCSNNGGEGIYIYYNSDWNNITDNILSDNENRGLEIYQDCDNNSVRDNEISESSGQGFDQDTGIHIQNNCGDNIIEDNLISNQTEYGIYLNDDVDNTLIKNNRIINNTLIGAFIDDLGGDNSENNNFTQNVFEGNTLHAKDDINTVVNYWYAAVNQIGNSWDNYTELGPSALDADDDLQGDIDYPIAGEAGRYDIYPIFDDGDDFNPSVTIDLPDTLDEFDLYLVSSLEINITAIDSFSGVNIVKVMINASTPFNITMIQGTGNTWTCNWDNIGLYDLGDYNLTIWAIDNNGNINQTASIVITIIDTTPDDTTDDDDDSANDDDDDDKEPPTDITLLSIILGIVALGAVVGIAFFIRQRNRSDDLERSANDE